MMKNVRKFLVIFVLGLFVAVSMPSKDAHAWSIKEAAMNLYNKGVSLIIGNIKCTSTDEVKEQWNESCYTCMVVAQLIDAFMNGAGELYDTTSVAGHQILLFGFIIWAPFWAFKHIGSMKGANSSAMVGELMVMLFKIGCAYIIIGIGIETIVGYTIGPILTAGADFGNAIIGANSALAETVTLTEDEMLKSTGGVLPTDDLNEIMKFAKTASNSLSILMIVGSALSCFGFEHFLFAIPTNIGFIVLFDFMRILLGIVIWCIGFMLSLSVCYYLLDLAFKLGFAVLLMPIAIGLWPFPLKQANNKVGQCIKIAINAAGTFIMLSITVSLAMVLIDSAFANKYNVDYAVTSASYPDAKPGTAMLMEKIDKDDKEYVRGLFDITEPFLLILFFCLTAAFKIIGKTETYANKFFAGGTSAGSGVMHGAATAITNKVTKPVVGAVKTVGNIAAHQTGKGVVKAASFAGGGIRKAFGKKKP